MEGTQRIPCAVGAPGRWEDAGCRARRWVTVTEPRGGGQGGFPGTSLGQGGFVHPPQGAARRGAAAPALPRSFFHPFPVLYPKTSWLGENPAGAPRVYEAAAAVGLPQRGSWLSPSVVWGLQRSGCWWGAGGVLVSQVGAVGTTRLCPPHLSPFSSWEEPPGGAESAPGGVGEGGRGLSPQGAPFILPWLRPPASSCRPRGFRGKQTPEADRGTGAAAPGGAPAPALGALERWRGEAGPKPHTIWGGAAGNGAKRGEVSSGELGVLGAPRGSRGSSW